MKHLAPAAPWRILRSPQWLGLLFGLMCLSVLAMPAWADPPGRIGRLSELNGQVWIYASDSNEWIAALRNRPITTGDRLSTENDGRAEVRIGSTVLRVAPNTEIEVTQLDDDHANFQLHAGSVTARLRTREAADEFGLATEEGRFRTEQAGSFRFDRLDDTSSVSALSGQAVYEGDGTALTVQTGQRVEFWKERGAAQYSVTSPQRDAFSDWVASRDQQEARSVSTRYVSPEMTGVEDLDRYGSWEQSPDYGAVWTPRQVAPDWAPYRMGHWAWVNPWGWTWVDDAPWGFAPFHYGRWVWFHSNWCWTPGRYVAHPVYAPALVAWVGGANLSLSVSSGRAPTVGWFPLGPHEVFVPGYHVSPRYVREVNVTHVTNITNVNVTNIINSPGQVVAQTHYANRGLPHAVTVVPVSVVEHRQPVAPALAGVNDRVLRDMVRERPRADAPVASPPRFEPGANRRVEDPRISRPGAASGRPAAPPVNSRPAAPPPNGGLAPAPRPVVGGNPDRERGDRGDRGGDRGNDRGNDRGAPRPASPTPTTAPVPAAPIAPPTAQAPRPVEPPHDRRGREAPGATVPQAPANTSPPVANAPPPRNPPPGPSWSAGQRNGVRGNPPPPPAAQPDKAPVPTPPREEHRREIPTPPRVIAPAPTPTPPPPPPQAKPPVAAPRAPEAPRPHEGPPPQREGQPRGDEGGRHRGEDHRNDDRGR